MDARATLLRHDLKLISRRKLSLSGLLLTLSFFVIPFDAYLGSQNLSFITIGILLLFMLSRAIECSLKGITIKFKFNIVTVYLAYNVFSALYGMIKIGATYNNLLFLSMVCFFVVFVCWPASARELQCITSVSVVQMVVFIAICFRYVSIADGSISVVQMVVFIAICFRYVSIADGSIYMGIRDIVDPNYLVTNSLLMIAFFLYKFQQTKKISVVYALIQVCILFLYIVCIAFIGSRGGLVTACAVIVAYLLLQTRKPLRAVLFLAVIGIIGLILFFNLLPSYITERFTLQHILQDGGSGRLTIWSNYLSYYAEQNLDFWLFGAGRDVPPTQIYLPEFGVVYYSHNLFIKVLIEGGIVGLALLVGSIVYLLRKGIVNKNGMFVAALIAFVVGAIFLDLDNMRIFYLILAYGVSINKRTMSVWKGNILLRRER